MDKTFDRTKTIGASEVAALFGLHSFLTARQLYYIKTGEIQPPAENAAMRRGSAFESVIADLYTKEYGEALTPHQKTIVCADLPGLSATPDFINDNKEPREFKTTRFFKGEPYEAHIIQLQSQMMCLGAKAGALVYYDLVTDNFHIYHFTSDITIQGMIRKAVEKFWFMVKEGAPPKVSPEDVEILSKHFTIKNKEISDRTGDNELTDAMARYTSLGKQISELEKERDGAKAIILDKMKDDGSIKCGTIFASKQVINVKEKIIKAHTQTRLTVKNMEK